MGHFKLYTEARPNLVDLVSRYVEGATLTLTLGLWQGEVEASVVVEMLQTDIETVRKLAEEICAVNDQREVLIVETDPCAVERVYARLAS